MLCIDTSSLIAFLEGSPGQDVELIDSAFADQVGVLSPVTVTEILSEPGLDARVRAQILLLPTLPITEGFWERAGLLRAKVRRLGRKAALADTLIAQGCLDNRATLLTRDRDFGVFARAAGLKLLPRPR